MKPVTVNDERRVLSHIFNKAVDYEYLIRNPFKKIKKLKEQQRRLYLTAGEIDLVFRDLESQSTTARNESYRSGYRKFKLYCEVLLNTGMRRSELIDLRPENIDFENNMIRLEQTKGKKRREIPMTNRVREILRQLNPVLFGDLTRDQVTHKFMDCTKRIKLRGLKLHSLRHTFGTYMIAMGFDITVVMELLGHEDIKTTLIYAKADIGLLREAMRSFEKLGRNGYKMVTKIENEDQILLGEGDAVVTDNSS